MLRRRPAGLLALRLRPCVVACADRAGLFLADPRLVRWVFLAAAAHGVPYRDVLVRLRAAVEIAQD